MDLVEAVDGPKFRSEEAAAMAGDLRRVNFRGSARLADMAPAASKS
ncbi:hypothetical protein [Actinoplanes sp. NPDC051411]